MKCDNCGKYASSLWPAPPRYQPSAFSLMNGEDRVWWCEACIGTAS